jgi:hypothetical protein
MNQFNPPAHVQQHVDLSAIARQVNADFGEAKRCSLEAVELYRKIGHALRLAKAKFERRGEWTAWLVKNVKCSKRQAQRYMKLAKSDVTSASDAAWRIISGNTKARHERSSLRRFEQDAVDWIAQKGPELAELKKRAITHDAWVSDLAEKEMTEEQADIFIEASEALKLEPVRLEVELDGLCEKFVEIQQARLDDALELGKYLANLSTKAVDDNAWRSTAATVGLSVTEADALVKLSNIANPLIRSHAQAWNVCEEINSICDATVLAPVIAKDDDSPPLARAKMILARWHVQLKTTLQNAVEIGSRLNRMKEILDGNAA